MPAPVQAADFAGNIAGKQYDIEVLPKITGAPIAKGDVIEYVDASDAFRTAAAASINSTYYVAKEPALSAATQVEAITSGAVTVVADGAIAPGDAVMVSGTTAGRVAKAVIGTAAPGSIVGRYIGKAGANFRNGMPVAAAIAGDVIIIDLNRRTS